MPLFCAISELASLNFLFDVRNVYLQRPADYLESCPKYRRMPVTDILWRPLPGEHVACCARLCL